MSGKKTEKGNVNGPVDYEMLRQYDTTELLDWEAELRDKTKHEEKIAQAKREERERKKKARKQARAHRQAGNNNQDGDDWY